MKKENIQSRNRKLSAKARKKHSSFPMNHHHPGVNPAAASIDMLKPLEKMYGYGAMGMAAAAGMSGMSGLCIALIIPKCADKIFRTLFKEFLDSVFENDLVVLRVDNLHDLSKELAVLLFLIVFQACY